MDGTCLQGLLNKVVGVESRSLQCPKDFPIQVVTRVDADPLAGNNDLKERMDGFSGIGHGPTKKSPAD
jgi:hypothetical protein